MQSHYYQNGNFSSQSSETTSLQNLIYESVENVKIPHFVAVTAGGVFCLIVCLFNTYKLCRCVWCWKSQKTRNCSKWRAKTAKTRKEGYKRSLKKTIQINQPGRQWTMDLSLSDSLLLNQTITELKTRLPRQSIRLTMEN